MKTNGRIFVRARRVARIQRRVKKHIAAGKPITFHHKLAIAAAIRLLAAKAELLWSSLHSRNRRPATKC